MRHLLPVLRALHEAGVRFVIVGGVGVVLQGHPRMTVDLDLVVELAQANVLAAIDALTAIGLVPRLPVPAHDFADEERRRAWVEQRNLTVFSLHDPTNPLREVDLFAFEPIPFDLLQRDASIVTIEGVPLAVASRQHLIAMKTDTGRPQDLADIDALRRLEDVGG